MEFKRRKIRKVIKPTLKPQKLPRPPRDPGEQYLVKHKRKITISLGLVGSIVVIILLFVGIAKAISSINFGVFLKVAGEELKTDTYGHSNFMILGTGGLNHDGADLTDTIIVASLDSEKSLISMVSIPRDTYVKDALVGNSRINEVYLNAKNHFDSSEKGIEHLKSQVENLMGVPIHYWVKIDFKGFKELIDALDGIDVIVETPINDPYYPADVGIGYSPFTISAGPHTLDGATALKYARSRKTTSDFDRAERQQDIIYAIKEKALQTEIMFSPEKIGDILDTLKSNIETNISVKEILTLGSLAKDFTKDQISHNLIHDDPTQCGGFFYTPERQYYNGMFVLIPAGGFDFIHLYSDLIFNFPEILREGTKIQILNGTKTGGVAGETKQILNRFCLDVVRFGNGASKDITTTTYYYHPEKRPRTLDFLQKIIPGKESTTPPADYQEYMSGTDLVLELGADYVDSDKYLSDPFYALMGL